MSFEDQITTKKGNLGEAEVDKILLSSGVIPYSPYGGQAHPFDRLCASKDKKHLFIAECKTKAARTYYPDTGFDLCHYNDYKLIQEKYNIDVFIFFIDENKQQIYGNFLSKLEKNTVVEWSGKKISYPLTQTSYGKKIIYFPLSHMEFVCKLEQSISSELKALSSRNYSYPAAQP